MSLGEPGQPRGFLLRLCWPFCCWPTLGPGHRGVCPSMEAPPLPSVLKVPPAAQSQERVSKDTENLSPISGDTGSVSSLSQCPRWGSVSASQPWEAPTPSASLLHREQVLLSAFSVPSWCPGLRQRETQPGSVTPWTLSHTHLPGNSNTLGKEGTLSVVLSPKL